MKASQTHAALCFSLLAEFDSGKSGVAGPALFAKGALEPMPEGGPPGLRLPVGGCRG